MEYKARYKPLEILEPTGWRPLTAEERETSG
jgi:arginyl-tRNA--protein-N-Asp/Glu arginylyltransferase